jgi:hypothetical protein
LITPRLAEREKEIVRLELICELNFSYHHHRIVDALPRISNSNQQLAFCVAWDGMG